MMTQEYERISRKNNSNNPKLAAERRFGLDYYYPSQNIQTRIGLKGQFWSPFSFIVADRRQPYLLCYHKNSHENRTLIGRRIFSERIFRYARQKRSQYRRIGEYFNEVRAENPPLKIRFGFECFG